MRPEVLGVDQSHSVYRKSQDTDVELVFHDDYYDSDIDEWQRQCNISKQSKLYIFDAIAFMFVHLYSYLYKRAHALVADVSHLHARQTAHSRISAHTHTHIRVFPLVGGYVHRMGLMKYALCTTTKRLGDDDNFSNHTLYIWCIYMVQIFLAFGIYHSILLINVTN